VEANLHLRHELAAVVTEIFETIYSLAPDHSQNQNQNKGEPTMAWCCLNCFEVIRQYVLPSTMASLHCERCLLRDAENPEPTIIEPHRVLFVSSNPPGTSINFSSLAQQSMRDIVTEDITSLFEVISEATWKTLYKRVRELKPSILHIWAHGMADVLGNKIQLYGGDIPLEKRKVLNEEDQYDLVCPKQLATLVHEMQKVAPIKCVLLSICDSNKHAEEVKAQNPGCFCIGFSGKVKVPFMLRWCEGFYSKLITTKQMGPHCVEAGFTEFGIRPVCGDPGKDAEGVAEFRNKIIVL